MPDVSPVDFGVNVAARAPAGRLTREQAAAHARLASLPTRRHLRESAANAERIRKQQELSETLRRARLNSTATYNAAPAEFGKTRDAKARVIKANGTEQ